MLDVLPFSRFSQKSEAAQTEPKEFDSSGLSKSMEAEKAEPSKCPPGNIYVLTFIHLLPLKTNKQTNKQTKTCIYIYKGATKKTTAATTSAQETAIAAATSTAFAAETAVSTTTMAATGTTATTETSATTVVTTTTAATTKTKAAEVTAEKIYNTGFTEPSSRCIQICINIFNGKSLI